MTGINKIGSEASALLTAVAQAKKDVKHTREANKRRIEQLRPLLQQVWDAFDRGETVNGQSTKKQWCEEFAFTTQRNVQYILAGGNKNRPDAKRFSMKNDAIITIHGKAFRIVNAPESVDDLQRIKGAGAVRYRLNMVVTPVEEKTEAAVPATATAQPVTHIRVSPRKALCQTRFVNRKIKGAVYAKNSEEVTCPDCVAIRDKTISSKGTLQEARERILPKNKKKTHALGTVLNDEIQWTICGKTIHTAEPGEIVIADDDKKPTCKTCLNHRKYRFGKQARKNRAEQAEKKQAVQPVPDTLEDCPTKEDYTEEEVKSLFEEQL